MLKERKKGKKAKTRRKKRWRKQRKKLKRAIETKESEGVIRGRKGELVQRTD